MPPCRAALRYGTANQCPADDRSNISTTEPETCLPIDEPNHTPRPNWGEERLALALEASGIAGAWDWDAASDLVRADDRACRLHGMDPALGVRGAPAETLLARVDPEDRPGLDSALAAAIDGTATLSIAYRVRLRGERGTVRWVMLRGRVLRDEAGQPTRLAGVALDITEQKHTEAALRESEARFRVIADTMPQAVWSALPDGYFDYFNRRWYELTGTEPGRAYGEAWAEFVHPDDRPLALERWRHSLATGDLYEVEYRLHVADGSGRWVLARALPVRDEDGQIERWFGTCTDIHDMRRVAEEREVLSHELSHRIKNIFSVTSALISLSVRSHPEAAEFAEDLRGRITALARAHEFARPHSKRSQPELGRTTLFHFLRDLLSPYAIRGVAPAEDRFIFGGEDLTFDDAAAPPLALLFHELATNAAKYGALSEPTGRVAISARREGREIALSWQESGGPTVPGPPLREGFGSRLALISVQGQLGGKVERRWLPEGLALVARLPAEALGRRRRAREKQ
jgi:PAS domain S-box-containing protein